MKILIADIEKMFTELFIDESKSLVKSFKSVYEKDDNGLKLILSVHNLVFEDSTIIHTKFIFRVDDDKRYIVSDYFNYLYEINCVYHKHTFNSKQELKNKIKDIIVSNDFGKDLQILSDFIESPSMFLNYYMKKSKITEYSVFDVIYEPKYKIVKCDEISFNFKININDQYEIYLEIRKIVEEDNKIYKMSFKFLDDIDVIESDTLKNIHFLIGSSIASCLDKKLKNK